LNLFKNLVGVEEGKGTHGKKIILVVRITLQHWCHRQSVVFCVFSLTETLKPANGITEEWKCISRHSCLGVEDSKNCAMCLHSGPSVPSHDAPVFCHEFLASRTCTVWKWLLKVRANVCMAPLLLNGFMVYMYYLLVLVLHSCDQMLANYNLSTIYPTHGCVWMLSALGFYMLATCLRYLNLQVC
jgi:hypothetical protein